MPVPPRQLAEDLKALLLSSKEKKEVMSWPDFYSRAGWKRFTQTRWEETQAACLAVGMILGYGNNAVSLCPDVTPFS